MGDLQSINQTAAVAVVVIGILQGFVGWLLKRMITKVEDKMDRTYDQVSQINGSIRELKVWKDEHSDRHGEQSGQTAKEHEELWKAVELLRTNCMTELRLWAEKR